MELSAYVAMASGAYIALLTRKPAMVYGWFVIFVAYSLIVRLSPEITGDMRVYYEAVTVWPPPLTLYTLREPVIWIGAPFLYFLTGDHVAMFLIIDILSGAIIIHSMRTLDDGDNRMLALAPTIICSYVFLLGQQNVLRQHAAFMIVLWALAARSRKQGGAIILFVASMLAHNATAVLFGYWFDVGCKGRRRFGPLITVVGVLLLGLLFPLLGKSRSATGLTTDYLYVALAAGVGLLTLYAESGRLSGARSSALLNCVAFLPAIGVLGSAQFERVAMIFLVLMLTDLYRHSRSLRIGEWEVAHLIFGILVVPVFVFPSALQFLTH